MRIRDRIAAKLRGKSGESIAETLIALLISALALLMLAGAVSSAANIVTKSRAAVKTYNESTAPGVRNDWADSAGSVLN